MIVKVGYGKDIVPLFLLKGFSQNLRELGKEVALAGGASRTPHIQTQGKYEILHEMSKLAETYGKFVRLKLTGEIVEVVGLDSGDIMINYRGQTLTMGPHEISRISPEEAAMLGEKRNSGLDLR